MEYLIVPYGINKVSGGWKVYNKNTGKTYSIKPHGTRQEALNQQAAMYVNANPKGEGNTKKSGERHVKEGFQVRLDIILDNL